MKWFSDLITREGPGVRRDAPPKHGLALLVDVIGREWWALIQLNLLCIVFSLPIVTAPAAQVAASRICALMLDDRPVYLLRDFWDAFRHHFWRATALGALGLAAIAIGVLATWTFLGAAKANIMFALPMVIALSTTVFVVLTTTYALTLLARNGQNLVLVIRLALLGALGRPLPVLGALAIAALLWLAHIIFYPASIFMPAVLNFSFGTLVVTFGVHQAAARLLALDLSASQIGTGARGSAQLRV
ncbi:MAG: YesL family protein [Devosia sp.]